MAKISLIVPVFLIFLAANTVAYDWDLTVSGGVSLPGEIVASDDLEEENFCYKLNKPTALLVRIALDLYHLPWLGGSIFMYTGSAPLKEEIYLGYWDDQEHTIPASGITILGAGGSLKGRIETGEESYVKPSIGCVYLHSFSESPDARMNGFVVVCEMEYEYPISSSLGGIAQLGAAYQLYGGVKDVVYVTFGPVFYITMGVTF